MVKERQQEQGSSSTEERQKAIPVKIASGMGGSKENDNQKNYEKRRGTPLMWR